MRFLIVSPLVFPVTCCLAGVSSADQLYDIKACLLREPRGEIVIPSATQVEKCLVVFLRICIADKNYVLCLKDMRDNLMAFGEERWAMMSNQADSTVDLDARREIMQEFEEWSSNCASLSVETKAMCEFVLAGAYNIETSRLLNRD